jgi:sulfate/thiosulfate transport system substrate-binding protein
MNREAFQPSTNAGPPAVKIPANRSSPPALYRLTIYLVVALLTALVLYQLGLAIFAGSRRPVKLVVYGFSTQEEAFSQRIFPEFEAFWEAKTGNDLKIEGVFGPSGDLASQIILGAPADVAIFSNAQHVAWLQVGRQVDQDTQAAIFGYTPMVIVTRPGNPAGIKDFADLAQPGVRLLHPEPGRSGAGDWAILAEYGSAYLAHGDRNTAEAQLEGIWNNVKVLGSSARATLTLFDLGAGDALVTYEQDALFALDQGIPLEIVLPPKTIIAQHMVVLVDANITPAERAAAEDFVHYLLSDSGQRMLEQYHLRSTEGEAGDSTPAFQPFTVEDLGGWSRAYQNLIEGLWKIQIAPQLETQPLPTFLNGRE